MRLSQLFTKALKEAPKDEVSINARLLVKAGYIQKLSAGVYSFLPLGFRVLRKIEQIIREEMNAIGGQELLMPVIHPKEIWEETGRWEEADYLYKLKDRQEKEWALGATHEEVITDIGRKYINSYRDLPLYLYQIQTKFRDELRPKSGLLRTREFSMKDLYSFHTDEHDRKKYYEKVKDAYLKILKRCGFEKILVTEASGGSFSKEYSHEFQIPTVAGEDLVIFCQHCGFAQNKEICELQERDKCPNCDKELKNTKTIEVGNIFTLGTRYSKPMSLTFIKQDGSKKPVIMSCYGIGPSRLMGAAVEIYNDKNGIIWPEEIAPFNVHIVQIEETEKVKNTTEKLYQDLQQKNIEVLYDNREGKSAGEKFAEADLLGVPWRVVISEKTVKENKVELKNRAEEKIEMIDREKLIKILKTRNKR